MPIAVSNLPSKLRIPRAFFVSAKNAVLDSDYELSVAFVTPRAMRSLNKRHRGKESSTDILSFSLSPSSGEIIFSMADVQEQAPLFRRTPSNFLKFLFIHGLLHLKGYVHGGRMERQEIKFRKKFGI